MPKSLSHVVVLTDDLDAVLGFVTDVARIGAVSRYETEPEDLHALFGWPLEHGRAQGAFVGEGPGALDVLEIPAALRDSVQPGVRLLAVVNRDVEAAGAVAAATGLAVRGPFHTTAATGAPMSLVEVVAGGLPFELVQFGVSHSDADRRRDELDFSGRTAVVTGSSRNIGRAIVLELASRGANVVINTRTDESAARAVEREARELGADTLVVIGDAGERATIDEIATRAQERFGHVDISVSNAARRLHRSFAELTDDDWHYYLNQQLTASWYLAKAFVPGMQRAGWGRLIHVNGPDAWVGGPGRAPHSAAKAALRNLTKSLARELGPSGITVNDVVPGFQDTVRDPVTHPQLTPEFTAEAITRIPIRRLPTMGELAWACAFLCSTRSDGITGTAIHVDGGQFVLG